MVGRLGVWWGGVGWSVSHPYPRFTKANYSVEVATSTLTNPLEYDQQTGKVKVKTLEIATKYKDTHPSSLCVCP
jgi:hypothetical protein